MALKVAPQALQGIRVLDLSTGIAGPLAGMLLADYGADVVKVEPPTGDPARALAGFAVWNRNKRGIIIDRQLASGERRLKEFLAGADVCIVSQPGDEALSQAHPCSVVLHMPPYTPAAAPWAGGAESHGLLTAFGGPSSRQSSFDGGPIDLVYPLALYVQGQWAAATAVAALIERERSGFGQRITVAGIHGVVVSCAGQMLVVPSQAPLPTNVGPGGRHPCYTAYQCQDGRWLFMAALIAKFQANAFNVLGVGNLFADERIQGIPSRMLLPENRGWIRQKLADAFKTKSRDEWLALLAAGDCPAGPVGDRDTWLDHPQIEANGLRVELDDPQRGRVVMPGLPLSLGKTPGQICAPAPTLGQHDDEVEPWDPHPTPVGAPPPAQRGPLAGLRILDLGTILAGPYAGALLAELGADVIKVESPAGDAFREPGFVYNRGQRSLSIDLSQPAARAAFYELVRTADALIDNSRLGVPERLQVHYAGLAQVKPDIVTFSITGLGEQGPLAAKPAFDPVLQAMSGMMAAQGGDSEPVLFTIAVNDIAAATLAVFGVCLGLFHRLRTGEGQRVCTSLLACSTMMQSGELVRFAGRPPAVRGARDFAGPSALDRFYRAADGWLRIQAPDVAALESAGLFNVRLSRRQDREIAEAVGEVLASKSVAESLACLSAAGIPAAPVRRPGDLLDDPELRELDLFATQHMHDGTAFSVIKRYARFSRTQECANFEAPGLGEHSRSVLEEAGVASDTVDALMAAGFVKQGEPFRVTAISNYR